MYCLCLILEMRWPRRRHERTDLAVFLERARDGKKPAVSSALYCPSTTTLIRFRRHHDLSLLTFYPLRLPSHVLILWIVIIPSRRHCPGQAGASRELTSLASNELTPTFRCRPY